MKDFRNDDLKKFKFLAEYMGDGGITPYSDWNHFIRVLERANTNKHVTIYKNEIYRHILSNEVLAACDYLYANILYETVEEKE